MSNLLKVLTTTNKVFQLYCPELCTIEIVDYMWCLVKFAFNSSNFKPYKAYQKCISQTIILTYTVRIKNKNMIDHTRMINYIDNCDKFLQNINIWWFLKFLFLMVLFRCPVKLISIVSRICKARIMSKKKKKLLLIRTSKVSIYFCKFYYIFKPL